MSSFSIDCGNNNAALIFTKQAKDALVSSSASKHATQVLRDDELANEYLLARNVIQKPVKSFSVNALLRELNVNRQQTVDASPWVSEYDVAYSNAHNDTIATSLPFSKAWADSLPTAARHLELEEAWDEAVVNGLSGIRLDSNTKWATEYLEEADSWQQRNVQGSSESWTSEYGKLSEATEQSATKLEDSAEDFWNKLESEWDNAAKQHAQDYDWLDEYDSLLGHHKDYEFAAENPFSTVVDALERGKQLLNDGDLSNAILMFESSVASDPSNAEAWQLLGAAQAENEQEQAAIAALRRCLDLDPKNMSALMLLATSYTNEALYLDAAKVLKRWLQANSRYAYLQFPVADEASSRFSSYLDPLALKEIEELLLKTIQRELPLVDPDVQNALGILYNISGEYDKAVDCIEAALSAKPEDARLWNRLGATLANSGRSQEAVSAYASALQRYPGFVRARYNLGISCMNLKAHREAIEHLIGALALQQRGLGPSSASVQSVNVMSLNIWNTLRTALSQIDRQDLFVLVDNRDFASLAAEFGVTLATS